MDIFSKIADFVTGGTLKTVTDVVMAYLPPDMSPEKKAEIQLAAAAQEAANKLSALTMAHEMDKDFNKRITDLEGTASDLKSLPIVGPILLFFRGAQRPVWGFATIYLDYQVFSNNWSVLPGSQQSAAFYVINVLVLGFLFGERAIQNVMPYIIQYFGVKQSAPEK